MIPRAVLAVAASIVMAASPPVRIAPLEVRFYLEQSGGWTKNMLDSKSEFVGWNTGAGDGDIPGPATDAIVVASLTSPGASEDVYPKLPVVMTATVGKKVIASRKATFVDIPQDGQSHLFLALHEIQCAGTIDIRVSYGAQVRAALLKMDCGE